MFEFSIIFVIGFFSSFFGSFTSGGTSLLAFSLLSMYGLPTLTSLAVYRVGNVGFQLGGLFNYLKADKVVWKYVLPLTLIGIVATFIGGKIVLSIDEDVLSKIIGFGLLLFIPISLFKPALGVKEIVVSNTRKTIGYAVYFLTSIWGSSFVIGSGLFNMFSQTYFFGMTLLQVKGTAKIPGLVKSLILLALFIQADIVNWKLSIFFFFGMLVGSLCGTYFTVKLGDKWLRCFLIAMVLVVSIKLIVGL